MARKQSKKKNLHRLPDRIMSGRVKPFYKRLARGATWAAAGLLLISLASVLCLRFINPVTSAFMVERICAGIFTSRAYTPIQYQWVALDKISPRMALAAVAAEDQKFPNHFGFDFASIVDALEDGEDGHRIRGASTITQQTAKNLFLWNGRSFIRKGMEAYFTILLEVLWPKKRIIEVYLNIAEFGDGIYGVEAAARKYFKKPASRLTPGESALLAAVLPNPTKLKAGAPSEYVKQRSREIEQQMNNLGMSYLEK